MLSLHSPPSRLDFSERFFALNCALDWEKLWQASLGLINAALPHHSCSLLIGIKDQLAADSRHSVAAGDHFNYSAAGRLVVSGPFLARHPGIKLYTYSDMLRTDALAPHRRLEKEVVLSGWSQFVHLVFWDRRQPDALLSIRRTADQGDFTDEERSFLADLHATIEAGLHRLRQLHQERRRHAIVQEFMANLPLPVLVLDENLTLTFSTQEGYELCSLWNNGASRARLLNARGCFRVPRAVAAACRTLQAGGGDAESTSPEIQIAHPGLPGLQAHVALRKRHLSPWTSSDFIVTFSRKGAGGSASGDARPDRLESLNSLTAGERQVALLVAEGQRNQEIAVRLGKSVRTVEFQLNAIYKKLGLRSRTELTRLLA